MVGTLCEERAEPLTEVWAGADHEENDRPRALSQGNSLSRQKTAEDAAVALALAWKKYLVTITDRSIVWFSVG